VPHDVLQHDHRVVDQHAHRERDAAERHDVEREVEHVHQHESADYRDRDCKAGDEGRARVAQEEVEHEDREQAADQRRLAHLADRRGDELRLVVDELQLAARRQRLAEFLDPRPDAGRELHRIGVALLVDRELDRLATVHARDGLAVLVAARDARDVPEVHGLAVDVRDDRVRHRLHRGELVQRAHQEALRALLEAAAGEVHVFFAQAVRNLVD
jgi:hypothetical protein